MKYSYEVIKEFDVVFNAWFPCLNIYYHFFEICNFAMLNFPRDQ